MAYKFTFTEIIQAIINDYNTGVSDKDIRKAAITLIEYIDDPKEVRRVIAKANEYLTEFLKVND